LYSPPEIITLGRCNEKADMWSLGVCVFILICGYPPFQPDEKYDLEDNITHARYIFRQDDGWDNVSALARDLIARLLVLDPETRFSAKQVLEHPWIIATEKAVIQTGPPMLKRLESTIILEELAEKKKIEKTVKKVENQSNFLNYAKDVRRVWDEEGWKGMMHKISNNSLQTPIVIHNNTQNEEQTEEELTQIFNVKRQQFLRMDSGKLFLRNLYESTSPLLPPTWVKDSEASVCRLCEEPFSWLCLRRHHCRACGQVVCNSCSSNQRIVSRVDPYNKVRVCDLCRISSRRQTGTSSALSV
jgi:serine/threonine protein kinase